MRENTKNWVVVFLTYPGGQHKWWHVTAASREEVKKQMGLYPNGPMSDWRESTYDPDIDKFTSLELKDRTNGAKYFDIYPMPDKFRDRSAIQAERRRRAKLQAEKFAKPIVPKGFDSTSFKGLDFKDLPLVFQKRILRDKNTECWLWTGEITWSGYGKIWDEPAHRLVYTFLTGPIHKGAIILHSCDNRMCVNPSHLTQGTYAQNYDDMVAKGRAKPFGPSLGDGGIRDEYDIKLSEIKGIRILYFTKQKSINQLVRMFGISGKWIKRIINFQIK